ncbi:NUDIX domain-containing protein [Maribellus sp. YY47]|uniref:NUDIX hydrolase n=1 Tax=Maribellus sp. YY47 TaxID=2929486 RepID=UPI002001D783|nr:NUDIX domain-containing protein [Maribellus sp. YY47]MCK3682580.1 NUDIX domain-containing protein [Maribellus sp. YY47]
MQKYKVFLNEKRIRFSAPTKITLAKTTLVSPAFTSSSEVFDYLGRLLNSEYSEAVVEHDNPEEAFLAFRSALLNIDAAGGVVKRKGQLLFIFRNGKWDLPKGKIDKGESAEEAALREVEEECGITGHSIVKPLPPTFHIYQSPYKDTKGEWIFKQTHWFEMEYNGQKDGLPEAEEGISEVRWFHPSELDEVLSNTYDNLKELIQIYT